MGKSFSKSKVLLVGTFHMNQMSEDMHNSEVDDILSERRQQEIREVVDKLKGFNPTKVALEIVTEDDEAVNSRYKEYIDGKLDLKANECHQLGFRIASELKHDRIYAIDWMERGAATRPYGDVYEWAKANQTELFEKVFSEDYFHNDAKKSILEMYQTCNDKDEIKKSHEGYINMARIGDREEYVGMGWLIWWYQRNLILFSNICRLAESENERILVIIGCSHAYLLDQFLRESDAVELIDVNKFLKEN